MGDTQIRTQLEWLVFKKQTLAEKPQSYNIKQSVNENKPLFHDKVNLCIFKYNCVYTYAHTHIHVCVYTHTHKHRHRGILCQSGRSRRYITVIKMLALCCLLTSRLVFRGQVSAMAGQGNNSIKARVEKQVLCICFNLSILITMSENFQ